MSLESWGAFIVGIIGALGGKEIIQGVLRYMSGNQDREKLRVRGLIEERDNAEARAYDCSLDRSDLLEYAILLRTLLVEHGEKPEELPPWPVRRSEDV